MAWLDRDATQAFRSRSPDNQPCGRNTDCRNNPTCLLSVLTGARVGERLAPRRGQSECIVKFAVRQQSRIGLDHGTAKLRRARAIRRGGGNLYADRRVSVGAEAHQVVPDRAGAQHNALEFLARAFVRRQDLRNQQVAIFGDSLVRHFAAAQFVF